MRQETKNDPTKPFKATALIPGDSYVIYFNNGCGSEYEEEAVYVGALHGEHPFYGYRYVFKRIFEGNPRYSICELSIRSFQDSFCIIFVPLNRGADQSVKTAIESLMQPLNFRWDSAKVVDLDLGKYQNKYVRSNVSAEYYKTKKIEKQ